jgi:prophage maintenance system killer protein
VIFIGVPEAVLVASQVLDVTTEDALSGADLDVIGRILERARGIRTDRGDEGLARAAAAVLVGFVREVPFREGNDAVATACVLHLLALNGWDLEAGQPEVVRERIGRIRADEADLGESQTGFEETSSERSTSERGKECFSDEGARRPRRI